jgi:hypothetical protein
MREGGHLSFKKGVQKKLFPKRFKDMNTGIRDVHKMV